MLFQVFAVPRVARDDNRPAVVIDAITVSRLYQRAMVHFKSGHLHAVLLIDDTVAYILGRRYCYSFHGILLVLVSDSIIVGLLVFEVLHIVHLTFLTDKRKRVR